MAIFNLHCVVAVTDVVVALYFKQCFIEIWNNISAYAVIDLDNIVAL